MKFSLRDSRIASVGLASVIAVGVIGVGSVAMAQEGSGDSGTPSTQSSPDGSGHGHARKGMKFAAGIALKNLDITREEIQAAAGAGLTNAQLIDQYGNTSSVQAKAAALAALETRLTEAVANGKVTQEKADEVLGNAPAKIDEFLARTVKAAGGGNGHRLPSMGADALETIAGIVGTDVETLKSQLKEGQTVAQIAGDQTDEVIDALVAAANARIDEAVANGKIDADKAAEMKSKAADRIATWVNEGGKMGRRGGHGSHSGSGGTGFGSAPADAQ